MRFIRILLGIIFLVPIHALAWTHGQSGTSGSAQINLGGGDFIPANLINVFNTASLGFDVLHPSDAGKIDDNGYLISSPAGNVSVTFPTAGTMWSSTTYKLRWDAGVQFSSLSFNIAMSSCVAVNATFTGCTGGTAAITTTGGAGSVTFTTATNQFSMFFTSGGTYSHSSGALSLYRLSDEADFLAGEIFTPEFKAVLRGLNPKTIRPMGWVQRGAAGFNGETNWNYRIKPTNFTWGGTRIPPGAWGGTIGGTDTYTGSAAPDTPVSWTDGETYIAVWTFANTSTTPSLDIAGRGAKTIIAKDANALSAGSIAAGTIGTVVYDGILDKLIYAPGGIQASAPIEAQVQLANRINVNLWPIIPPLAGDNYVTSWGTALCSGLNVNLYPYPEYTNELWNPGFPQTNWALQRGLAFGWVLSGNQAMYGWYGLRVRQIMGNLLPPVCSRPMRRVMAYQIGGDTTNISNRFKGAQLTPTIGNSLYCTFTGGAFSGSCSGGADYTTKPNRPQDVAEVQAGAPYVSGTNLCEAPDIGCTPTAANAPFYQALVNAWEAGQFATAIAMVDTDIRTGITLAQTVTASGTTFTTPLAHGFTASSTSIVFHVSGGTLYSGLAINTLYRVTTTPTASTFTIQPYVSGFPSGANVNAGSAGSGTVTVGASQTTNMTNVSSTWYQFAESNAAVFDGDRPVGMANVRVEQYEANIEPVGLSAAQCTTLGITGTNCAASTAAAILAWKADPLAAATQQDYFNQFMGTDASMPSTFGLMLHSRTPSQLILPNVCGGGTLVGAGSYAMLSDCLPNSTPFQTYNGFAAFHSGLN